MFWIPFFTWKYSKPDFILLRKSLLLKVFIFFIKKTLEMKWAQRLARKAQLVVLLNVCRLISSQKRFHLHLLIIVAYEPLVVYKNL